MREKKIVKKNYLTKNPQLSSILQLSLMMCLFLKREIILNKNFVSFFRFSRFTL